MSHSLVLGVGLPSASAKIGRAELVDVPALCKQAADGGVLQESAYLQLLVIFYSV